MKLFGEYNKEVHSYIWLKFHVNPLTFSKPLQIEKNTHL